MAPLGSIVAMPVYTTVVDIVYTDTGERCAN